VRRELIGFAGIVERNVYLIRRFAWWELAWFLYTVATRSRSSSSPRAWRPAAAPGREPGHESCC